MVKNNQLSTATFIAVKNSDPEIKIESKNQNSNNRALKP
jgi:hypothetical protein